MHRATVGIVRRTTHCVTREYQRCKSQHLRAVAYDMLRSIVSLWQLDRNGANIGKPMFDVGSQVFWIGLYMVLRSVATQQLRRELVS